MKARSAVRKPNQSTYTSPDELSEIHESFCKSDTALRHIDALMGAEFTDMLVHRRRRVVCVLTLPYKASLTSLASEVRSLFHKLHRKPFGWKATTARCPCWSPRLPCSCPQSAGTRIPKRWSARQLAGELRHSPVHRDASHDGSFSILVHSALFGWGNTLDFSIFATLTVWVCKYNHFVSVPWYAKRLRISAIKSVDAQSCLSALLPALHAVTVALI